MSGPATTDETTTYDAEILEVNRLLGKRDHLQSAVEKADSERVGLKRDLVLAEEALSIAQRIGRETQNEVAVHIGDVVTDALQILNEPYEFVIEFVEKRNKTEAVISFVRDGMKLDPIPSSGGGAVDVASFALRIALWAVSGGRPVMILDEPFRFLSAYLRPKAGELLQRLSETLGLQFIVVSHEHEHMPEYADKVFVVEKNGLESKVKEKGDSSK